MSGARPRAPIFYGWWMVAACLVVAIVSWSLGLFGSSVYLHAVTQAKGWSIGLVSSAITLYYVAGAVALIGIGGAVARFGPRPVMTLGVLGMAAGVAGLGRVTEPWHVHAAFLVMGLGWACLSTTAITTTLAPWFERHQGRAVSTALMGASVGGMIAAPLLLFAIDRLGFPNAMLATAIVAIGIVLPLVLFVMRRRPEEMGLFPDGEPPRERTSARHGVLVTRASALRTAALRSVIVAFGIGLMIQVGFLTHHVALVAPSLGPAGTSVTISLTALTAFLGRVGLARFSDHIDVRRTTGAVLLLATCVLIALALVPVPAVLIGASALFGLTVGNVTTLSPIVVRREFGAESFGAVYGAAATGIQLISALGPTFFGVLRDAFGGYTAPLLIAAGLDLIAAAVVVLGGRTPPVIALDGPLARPAIR